MARGRGQLSGIERLPPACDEIIAWAATELQAHKRTQLDIYEEFFNRLNTLKREHRGELEFNVPSFQAFNRYSIKLATMTRRIQDTREIAAALAKTTDAKSSDELTLIAAEAIKTLVFETLTNAGEGGIEPKGALALAGALYRATQAQGVSTKRRQTVEKDFEIKVGEAVDKVAKLKGLSEDTVEAIKSGVLGMRNG